MEVDSIRLDGVGVDIHREDYSLGRRGTLEDGSDIAVVT
jgi:hypothetical protein